MAIQELNPISSRLEPLELRPGERLAVDLRLLDRNNTAVRYVTVPVEYLSGVIDKAAEEVEARFDAAMRRIEAMLRENDELKAELEGLKASPAHPKSTTRANVRAELGADPKVRRRRASAAPTSERED
jgi:hypothetical protein